MLSCQATDCRTSTEELAQSALPLLIIFPDTGDFYDTLHKTISLSFERKNQVIQLSLTAIDVRLEALVLIMYS